MSGKYYSLRDELIDSLDSSFSLDTLGDIQEYGSAYKLIVDYYGRDCIVREGICGFVDVEYFPTLLETGKRNPAALDAWAEIYNEETDFEARWDETLAELFAEIA